MRRVAASPAVLPLSAQLRAEIRIGRPRNLSCRRHEYGLQVRLERSPLSTHAVGVNIARRKGVNIGRRLTLGIGEQTLEVRAVEVTGSNIGEAPTLAELLSQIPDDQKIGSVTADGAYNTRNCHYAIADRGANAVIPPRKKNAQPWKPNPAGAVARNDALRASKYLGRALWRNWSGYHRRSRVETKMHCVKLLGQRLTGRDFNGQVAEIQVRIAVLNGYTALGINITGAIS